MPRPAQAPITTLPQTLVRHDAHEREHRQENERERVESRAETRSLADERERDRVAGQRGKVDARAAVCLRDRGHPRGSEGEMLRGRERDGRSQTVAEPSG